MTPDDGDLIRNNLVLNSLLHAPTPCGKVKQIAQNECAALPCARASELENCLLADAPALRPVMKYPTRTQPSPLSWESLSYPYLRRNKSRLRHRISRRQESEHEDSEVARGPCVKC